MFNLILSIIGSKSVIKVRNFTFTRLHGIYADWFSQALYSNSRTSILPSLKLTASFAPANFEGWKMSRIQLPKFGMGLFSLCYSFREWNCWVISEREKTRQFTLPGGLIASFSWSNWLWLLRFSSEFPGWTCFFSLFNRRIHWLVRDINKLELLSFNGKGTLPPECCYHGDYNTGEEKHSF